MRNEKCALSKWVTEFYQTLKYFEINLSSISSLILSCYWFHYFKILLFKVPNIKYFIFGNSYNPSELMIAVKYSILLNCFWRQFNFFDIYLSHNRHRIASNLVRLFVQKFIYTMKFRIIVYSRYKCRSLF